MKKSIFLLWLLTIAGITLTACGSKNYEMSFDDALQIANHSAFQDILAENNNFEQDFNLAGSFDKDWTKVDADISSTSKQSLNDKNSESSVKIDANITTELGTIKANGALDIKVVDDGVYLNLSTLDLTWSEDLGMITLMAEWFKNQWFSIPMTGLSDIPSSFSIFKDSKELNNKSKEIMNNEWSAIYSWKFTQFNWYNAWKFSLDNEKLNTLVKEYYTSDDEAAEIPELNIQNFEWYLVITWKDKVTTVIENMEIAEDDTIVNVNGYAGEDYEINMLAWDEPIISFTAKKKRWKYNVNASMSDALSLDWTISPKLSKSSIDLNFDAKITVKEEWNETVIPFKGSWKYNSISEFSVTAPENAQDLTDLLWAYLWNMMWWDEYNYDEDYEYDAEDIDEYDIEEYDIEEYDTETAEDNIIPKDNIVTEDAIDEAE